MSMSPKEVLELSVNGSFSVFICHNYPSIEQPKNIPLKQIKFSELFRKRFKSYFPMLYNHC